ncbi:hypothetical protein LINGRAHAP2_LOCUS7846, partial [Linum grandiflorum]
MLEMQQLVKELGLVGEIQLFWQLPKSDFHNGLKLLATEEDVLEMTKAVSGFRLMKVYIKHLPDFELADSLLDLEEELLPRMNAGNDDIHAEVNNTTGKRVLEESYVSEDGSDSEATDDEDWCFGGSEEIDTEGESDNDYLDDEFIEDIDKHIAVYRTINKNNGAGPSTQES